VLFGKKRWEINFLVGPKHFLLRLTKNPSFQIGDKTGMKVPITGQ